MARNQYKTINDYRRQEWNEKRERDIHPKKTVKRKTKSKGSLLKRLVIWSLIGILFQIPAYYFLNLKIQEVMNPNGSSQMPLNQNITYTLAAPNIKNPAVSFDDNYLAYSSGNKFCIYDFSQHEVIWNIDLTSCEVLGYQWLPDRNALLVFESGIGVDPNRPNSMSVGIHSLEVTGTSDQITDRFASSLPSSFQGSQISNISLSTATNLLYFSAKGQYQTNLYEVDVMKNLKRLNSPGESVDRLAVSPVQGTVYFNTQGTSDNQTLAQSGNSRVQVASNPLDKVLGLWNQQVYLGTVDQGDLVKIWTTADNQPSPQRPNFTLFWTGKIPWDKTSVVTINGTNLLVRTEETVYQVSSQGSKILKQGENSFFSPSGKYYYAYTTDSSGTSLERIAV